MTGSHEIESSNPAISVIIFILDSNLAVRLSLCTSGVPLVRRRARAVLDSEMLRTNFRCFALREEAKSGTFFVNIQFVFNGDRLALVKG
jgi:hypothetical protein